MAVHDRPAAFEGSDGFSYSVEIMAERDRQTRRRRLGRVLPLRQVGAHRRADARRTSRERLSRMRRDRRRRARRARRRLPLGDVQDAARPLIDANDAARRRRAAGGTRCATKATTRPSDAAVAARRRPRAARAACGTCAPTPARRSTRRCADGSRSRTAARVATDRCGATRCALPRDDAQARRRRRRACSSTRDARRTDWAIAEILPRRSALARRAPGGGQGERIVAANVDQVVVVFAAAKPEPHLRMLDRFLVIAEGNDLPARIIVNKVDLVEPDAARERFPTTSAPATRAFTSVKAAIGLTDLRRRVRRRAARCSPDRRASESRRCSTRLFPGAESSRRRDQRIGEQGTAHDRRRDHASAARRDGGYVIDTPGLREVGLWALPPEHLDRCFPEMRALSAECRYADCRHVAEPECAVIAGVGAGVVSAERYDSYRRLLDELAS